MTYKMVLIDLDGTLLNDKKEIDQLDIQVLQKLVDIGIFVVIATGRRYYSAKRFTEVLNRSLIVLANNGNIVRNIETDEVIDELNLSFKNIESIYRQIQMMNLIPFFHVNGYKKGYDAIMLSGDSKADYRMYKKGFGDRLRIVKDVQALEKEQVLAMIYMGEPTLMMEVEKKVKREHPDLNSHVVTNLQHLKGMLEIMHPHGSKWNAALKIAKQHQISADEIVAIGDDLNDYFMVKHAGLGVAMDNARSEIKIVADKVSPYDNNNAGVGKILMDIFGDWL